MLEVDPNTLDFYIAGETGPLELAEIPVVSGSFHGDAESEEIKLNADGQEVQVYRMDLGHYPGQLKIREKAAQLALKNNVSSTWAELGTAEGRSAFFLSQYLPQDGTFFLFDSFEGLPEDWVRSAGEDGEYHITPKGYFACPIPSFKDKRLVVIPGWFEDTLPLAIMQGPLGLIHIDSDMYESCKTVLDRLDAQIVPGTVILLDELWGYQNWRDGEYKALKEWDRNFRYVMRDTKYRAIIECV